MIMLFVKKALKEIVRRPGMVLSIINIKFGWFIRVFIRKEKGTTDVAYDRELVVSLTSFPDRINTVHETIKSLLSQTLKPNRVVLWLAEEQFPQKERELPDTLLKLLNTGLEIRWCSDIKSYKKLIPSLEVFQNAIIVTADDDLYFRRTWLEVLYRAYLTDKKSVWAHRVTRFEINKNEYKAVSGGKVLWPVPTYLHKLTGGAGALYPPGVLYKDICCIEKIFSLCPTNDDIWFWIMGALNGTMVKVVKHKQTTLLYVGKTQKGPTLSANNDHGEHLFWRDFNAVIAEYPEIDRLLKSEYQRVAK